MDLEVQGMENEGLHIFPEVKWSADTEDQVTCSRIQQMFINSTVRKSVEKKKMITGIREIELEERKRGV